MGPLPEVLMSLDSSSSQVSTEVLVNVEPIDRSIGLDAFSITVPNWYTGHQFKAAIQKYTGKRIIGLRLVFNGNKLEGSRTQWSTVKSSIVQLSRWCLVLEAVDISQVHLHWNYTDILNANPILEEGFKPGPRALYGGGIYTSPNLEMVERYYAQEFKHKGKSYKIAFQNRVNPDRLKVIPARETGAGADYWLSRTGDARPYGVLIRKVWKTELKERIKVSG